ncbi:MAG: tetratricopeptide repeat protein [Gemmatimonadetes bacterium]|nr:tetratricopeptide repeat protein [Gemmatimonadota bacterium]
MRSWYRIGIAGLGALTLLSGFLLPQRTSAQVGEAHRLMILNLQPTGEGSDRFGRDVARELRRLISQFPTHDAIEEREVRDVARQYDVDERRLDCVGGQQMARFVDAQVIFCGFTTENRGDETFATTGVQFAAPGGNAFSIEDRTWGRRDARAAATFFSEQLAAFTEQQNRLTWCGQYYEAQDYASAEENCRAALELDPDNIAARYVLSHLLADTDRLDEAYDEVLHVLELDGLHESALNFAGYLAAQLGDRAAASAHYEKLLELDPDNAAVRMQVAFDLAEAGYAADAMEKIKAGLELAPDNLELLERYAAYAMVAAQGIVEAAEPGAPLSMEAGEYYSEALSGYQRAYEIKGMEMEWRNLRNMLATLSQLEQLDEAVDLAEEVRNTHGEEPQFWSDYANILNKTGDLDGALGALDMLASLDPEYEYIRTRQGAWLLDAGRAEEADPYFEQAIEAGEQTPAQVHNSIFNHGYQQGFLEQNWDYTVEILGRARAHTNQVQEALSGRTDFFYSYALFKQAETLEGPGTVESAQLTLPKFQQVQEILNQSNVAAFADTGENYKANVTDLLGATEQFILRQQRLIERGRRGW